MGAASAAPVPLRRDRIATTRIMPLHVNKAKSIAQCLRERTEYAMNNDKTDEQRLISAYACDPKTVDAEFLFSKKQYQAITGREEQNDVIAYHVRQSFKPGEVTPEEANQIGYDFAARFLKGKHAFIVCTHIDKRHIHNHIIWNSTTLDCTHKFRDFRRSGRAVARLSDLICTEHQLSVITDPKQKGQTYNKWLGSRAKPTHRERLRSDIDAALAKHPHTFEAFLTLMQQSGYTVTHGTHLSFSHPDFKRAVRLERLGDGYSEEVLRAVISGKKKHQIRKTERSEKRVQSVIDIQAKLAAGKGEGYRRWATVENLKRMAKTKLYMDEHDLTYDDLVERKEALSHKEQELSAKISTAQTRLAEVNILKTHIVNYSKTRDVYEGYRRSGYSKKYLAEHEADIIIHKAAKKTFDELTKIPTVKSLQAEFSTLLSEKKSAYTALKEVRDEQRELTVHKANMDELLKIADRDLRNENEHGRD